MGRPLGAAPSFHTPRYGTWWGLRACFEINRHNGSESSRDGQRRDGQPLAVKPLAPLMEEWLRIRAEEVQSSVVAHKSAMICSPPLYFTTRRCTYSDVVSIMTTTRASTSTSMQRNKELRRIRMPLKEPTHTSPLRKADNLDREEHHRRNKALWAESERFMAKLNAKRLHREGMESGAVLTIQKNFRGHVLRKNWEKIKRRTAMRRRVRGGMRDVTRGQGVVLAERDRKMREEARRGKAALAVQTRHRGILGRRSAEKEKLMRIEEIRNWGASVVQCVTRRRFAKRSLRRERQRWHEELRHLAVVAIQTVYRGYLGQKVMMVRRIQLEAVAVILIQRRLRHYLARKTLRKERVRFREQTTNLAAIDIQRMFRGRNGRRRVGHMRNVETEEIKEASILTIQRCFRGCLGRSISRDERRRQVDEGRLLGCMQLQRIFRGFAGRRLFGEENDKQRQDIFAQARLGNAQAVDDLYAGFGTDVMFKPTDVDKHGNLVLHIACRWGHKKIARKCLRWGMQIDHENDKSETAVQLAVVNGHGGLAEYLLSKNAQVSHYGRTLLHEAAHNGLQGTVEKLILLNVSPNELDPNNFTPLHEACGGGYLAIVQLLIDRGAEVNLQNSEGQTPLHMAATNGHMTAVNHLLQCKADVAKHDNKKRTPWRCALAEGHEAIALLLRQQWSQVAGSEESDLLADLIPDDVKAMALENAAAGKTTLVSDVLEIGLPIDFADSETGNTILMMAAQAGSAPLLELCLRKGADVNKENLAGQIALHFVAKHPHLGHQLAQLTADGAKLDVNGRTPLHEAALFGHTYEMLIKPNMDLNKIIDNNGRSILHDAASAGHAMVCKKLVELGINPSTTDVNGSTPLHLASCIENGGECINQLLGNQAQADARDNDGRTAAHLACRCGYNRALGLLLDGRASTDVQDHLGRTPAHYAIEMKSATCLRLLISNKADLGLADKEGHTALWTALVCQQTDCLTLLMASSPNAQERYGESQDTPLHIAARENFVDGITQLLEFSNSELIEARNAEKATPLMVAIHLGHSDIVKILLDNKANSKPDLPNGQTLLHSAAVAASASSSIISQLVEADIKAEAKDDSGLAPLHLAAGVDHFDTPVRIRVLVLHGAQVTQNDSGPAGMTPLHYAAVNGVIGSMEALLELGADIHATSIGSGKTAEAEASAVSVEHCFRSC